MKHYWFSENHKYFNDKDIYNYRNIINAILYFPLGTSRLIMNTKNKIEKNNTKVADSLNDLVLNIDQSVDNCFKKADRIVDLVEDLLQIKTKSVKEKRTATDI